MAKKEFLNFDQISKDIPFENVLNWLNVPYEKKGNQIKGEGFSVDVKKNMFFWFATEKGGGVINFVQDYNKLDNPREAAKLLQKQFLAQEHKPKREIPELTLHYCKDLEEYGISEETAKQYEVGLVKDRGVMAKKIAFKCYDQDEKKIGYVGWNKKDGWFYPKGFKRPLYNSHRVNTEYGIVVISAFDVLYLHEQGFPFTMALLGKSATDTQIDLLKRFKRLLIIHDEPQNINMRLSEYCFCKTIKKNSVEGLGKEQIKAFF